MDAKHYHSFYFQNCAFNKTFILLIIHENIHILFKQIQKSITLTQIKHKYENTLYILLYLSEQGSVSCIDERSVRPHL